MGSSFVTVFSKSIFTSSTFYINSIAILLLIAEAAVEVRLPIVNSPYFTYSILVLNILNRFRTKQPARLRKGKAVVVEDIKDTTPKVKN